MQLRTDPPPSLPGLGPLPERQGWPRPLILFLEGLVVGAGPGCHVCWAPADLGLRSSVLPLPPPILLRQALPAAAGGRGKLAGPGRSSPPAWPGPCAQEAQPGSQPALSSRPSDSCPSQPSPFSPRSAHGQPREPSATVHPHCQCVCPSLCLSFL